MVDDHLSFPTILFNMITNESKRGSPIRWVCNGEAFFVDGSAQPEVSNILKKYFNHGKYSSFQRQLNIYGWKKHFSGKYEGTFVHPAFHRDKKGAIATIKRRLPSGRTRVEKKLGTRKRKVKRSNSEASESSSLFREAALVKSNGSQETYYYGSDVSTTNENSTLGGGADYDDLDSLHGATFGSTEEPPNRSLRYTDNDSNRRNEQHVRGSISAEKKKAPTNKIILPYSLKKVMLSTWETMSQQQLVQNLPAAVTVRKALDSYVEAKMSLVARKGARLGGTEDRENLRRRKVGCRDMAEGIALFFDKGLESRLLYKQEMPQFRLASSSFAGKRFCEVYGCEYLLRLLLRLPDILTECVSDDKRRLILHDVVEFVSFLHQHQEAFFRVSFRKISDVERDELVNGSSLAS